MRRDEVSRKLERIILLKETSWRQKMRVLWPKKGDNNTKILHLMVNLSNKNNYIDALPIDGELSSDT